jgi:hypothetical protein
MLAVIPFGAGLALGAIFGGIVMNTAPPFARPAGIMLLLSLLFRLCATVALGIYAAVVVFLIGCFSVTERTPASIQFSAVYGFAVPATLSSLKTWSSALKVVSTPSVLTDGSIGLAAALILLLAITAPFLLMRKRVTPAKTPKLSGATFSAILWLTIAAAGLGCTMMLGWRYAWQRYDVGCRQVAAWVKSTHPVPGSYSTLLLPPSLSRLSSDSLVSSVVFVDGRVAVMLTTFAGGHTVSEYVIYCTGPITPAEIGTDDYGRSAVLPGELPMHFIESQIDSQHFEVLFDLG